MQAGQLTEIISIYRPEIQINDFGEQVQKYFKIREVRACLISNSGERKVNNEIVHIYNKTFKIRRYVDITETDRIKYNDKMYRILSIEPNRKFNETKVETELINE